MDSTDAEREYAEVRSEVRRIWHSVLPAETPDDDQGFFECGGSSIGMVKLLSLLNTRFPGAFTLVDLYEKPTIKLQARHLLAAAGMRTGPARPRLAARQRLAEMRRERRGAE